jgi:signal transduction histidine kinase
VGAATRGEVTVRRVLLVPLLAFAIAAMAPFAYVTTTLRQTSAALQGEVASVRRANVLAARLSQLSTEAVRTVLQYRLRPMPDGAERYAQLRRETDGVVEEMAALDLSPRGAVIWRQLVSARDLRAREGARLVAAVDRRDAHEIAVALERWTLATDKANALIADLTVFNLKRLASVSAELEDARARTLAWLFALLAAAVLAVVAFVLLVDRWIVRPVQAITRTSRHIAQDRVALVVPGRERHDELGLLARTVMEMAGDLVRANAELASSVAARDDFLSLAAHELKTPLSALKLHLQGSHRAWASRARAPTIEDLDTALRHTVRIELLIHDLLALAEIRAGRLAIERRRTDLSALVRDTARAAQRLLDGSRNAVELSVPDGIACDCDADRVSRVLANLLANASEHAPGTLVSVRLERSGAANVLEVEDGGPGIPEGEERLVFEPYRKGGATRRVRGLGLGLFLAKQVVEAHGGTIAIGAGARGGTRCRIALPIERPPEGRDVLRGGEPPGERRDGVGGAHPFS